MICSKLPVPRQVCSKPASLIQHVLVLKQQFCPSGTSPFSLLLLPSSSIQMFLPSFEGCTFIRMTVGADL